MTWRTDDYTLFVYFLLDEFDKVRYVGITHDPRTRLRVHMITCSQTYRGDTPHRRWVWGMKDRGLMPAMLVMEKVEGVRAARKREAHWIDVCRRLGASLTNTQGMPRQDQLWV